MVLRVPLGRVKELLALVFSLVLGRKPVTMVVGVETEKERLVYLW